MNKQITDRLDGLISEAIASGEFSSADEFMSALGHAIVDQHSREEIRKSWLKASILHADAEGGEKPFEEVFDRLDAKYAAMEEKQ